MKLHKFKECNKCLQCKTCECKCPTLKFYLNEDFAMKCLGLRYYKQTGVYSK